MFAHRRPSHSDPFRQMEQEMSRIFNIVEPNPVTPPVNIAVSDERVELAMLIPGIEPNSLDITLQKSLLTLSGERTPELLEESRPLRRERSAGRFTRTVTLPDDVDPERVEATYRDGVLQISVLRRGSDAVRKIEIK